MFFALIYESSIARAQPDPASTFRAWVAEAAPGLHVASWGGAGTGEVAYAAIVCTGQTTFGAWDAQWLVQTRDGRRAPTSRPERTDGKPRPRRSPPAALALFGPPTTGRSTPLTPRRADPPKPPRHNPRPPRPP